MSSGVPATLPSIPSMMQPKGEHPTNSARFGTPKLERAPGRCSTKIRGTSSRAFYFPSAGIQPLSSPLPCPSAEKDDIYIHSYEHGVQLWQHDNQGQWRMVQEGCDHPAIPDRVLHLTAKYEPKWVTRKTISTYRGRYRRIQAARKSGLMPGTL